MIESELFTLISQWGFPIVISIYLLITRDKIIQANTQAIDHLADVVMELCKQK